jgi:multiple sugar transport system substrate-binding protein
MSLFRKKEKWVASLLLYVLLGMPGLAGCSSAVNPGKDSAAAVALDETAPITLTWLFQGGQKGFDAQFGNAIYEKYPNVTVNVIDKYDPATTNTVPDMLDIRSLQDIQKLLIDYKIDYDMSEHVKKANFDLNRIEAGLLSTVKAYGSGKLIALPYRKGVYATYLNLDLFDRFGVPYPSREKPMTWQELLEFSKKFNRATDGVQYVGVVFEKWHLPLMALSPQGLDVKSNKTRFLSDPKFDRFFELMNGYRMMYQSSLPEATLKKVVSKSRDVFEKDQIAALYPRSVTIPTSVQLGKAGMNWDVVPFPIWGDAPKIGAFNEEMKLIAISRTNPHKEMSFKILSYLLSDEVQTAKNKAGSATVLTNRAVIDTFAMEADGIQGKNMGAIFALQSAAGPAETSKFEDDLRDFYKKKTAEFLLNQTDKNTMLRQMDEEFSQEIAKETAGGAK